MTRTGQLAAWFGAAASEADFAAVYQAEMPRVYNYFRYRVGHGPLAEDLTSETFEKAWRAREQYRRDLSAFSTWIFTIARRVAIDHYRRPRRETSLELGGELAAPGALDDRVQRQDELARLAAALGALDERSREIIALRYGAEMTNRRIAALLNLSESNVGVILHRAIQSVRTQWEDHHE